MEYVYASLLLHSVGKKVDENGLKKVIEAAGEKPDEAQIKAIVSNLEKVDIDEAIKMSAVPVAQAAAPAAAPAESGEAEKKKEEKSEEDEKKSAEEAASGLSSLFG